MSATDIRQTPKQIPDWIYDMKFCHLCSDENPDIAMCGYDVAGTNWCPDYDGGAICPGCGSPMCPRCCQLGEIEDMLNA